MEEEKENIEKSPNNPKETNSRRNFLKIAGAAAGVAALAATVESVPFVKTVKAVTAPSATTTPAITAIDPPFYQSPGLTKFTQSLRGVYPLDPQGIPVAVPDGSLGVGGAVHYKIDIAQYTDTLHPSLGGVTTLRGYRPQNTLGGAVVQRHLGGIIIANKGQPTQITFSNKLSLTDPHPIPIDPTIMGADKGDNRACTHLHGGYVPWISDGGPFAWFAPGNYGDSMQLDDYKVLNPKIKDGEAEYYYPNNQSARMLWYHDHSFGITRMNAYVGIASAYIIRDSFEAGLVAKGLPQYIEKGGRELPIVIQDKIFVGTDIATADPTWTGSATPGSLWYAHFYDPNRWTLTGNATPPDPSIIPEFFGDTMLANGVVYPEVTLEPRRYRLRILNACQARFLNLQLYVDDGSTDSITLKATAITPVPTSAPFNTYKPTNDKGPDFLVIGTEGGFLPNPVLVPSNQPFDMNTFGGSLITAPAERWDIIVDFSGFADKKIVLYNDAPAPFPMGDPINDYFPGNTDNPTTPTPGKGPNSRQIMRFNIAHAITGAADAPLQISTSTDLRPGNDPLLVPLGQTTLPKNIPVRRLTLNEMNDGIGRLIQMLGTDQAPVSVADGFGRGYMDRPTEIVNAGATEVWQIINLTGDTHPIHFHLVNVQIISRQPMVVLPDGTVPYNGGAPPLTGSARPPDKDEQGWKETVRVNPGEIANVIMKFKLPTVPFNVPQSRRTAGYGGNEYVWHCHILEHEEHDMMRPLIVKSNVNDNQQGDNNQQ